MLCEACKAKEALVHISTSQTDSKHFCHECADTYYATTPGMNSARDLITLSDFYRSKLYEELEAKHPEAFDNSTDDACLHGSEVMRRFLKQRLTKDNIKLNADGFDMLCHDFFCSHHFYDRIDKLRSGN